ncbi:MAG TPA: class I SAM-dependent methyltransferase [Pyrinomonadaceae bacterium]|nr:class I SAM-dependent methyltransferase [Pyrinomonadaceae bacterium]
MSHSACDNCEFDQYSAKYGEALAQGLAVSGEEPEYFARARMQWLADRLRELGEQPATAIDFGCGTGLATTFLFEIIGVTQLYGIDNSSKSLEVAKRQHRSLAAEFTLLKDYNPAGYLDLAFCNGVFHHIPPGERAAAIDYVYRSLRPGGLFAFWENNPWNPGTRYVMSRIPFDRDAITLTPPEARALLRAGGFEVLRTDFLFIFPRALHWLRGIEPHVARWPFGAQYQILGRRK